MSIEHLNEGGIEKNLAPQHIEVPKQVLDPVEPCYRPPEITSMTQAQIADAYRAALSEHQMPWTTALGAYRKALFWSGVFGTCIIMNSYDIQLHGAFFALPAFQKQFGHPANKGTTKYQLTPAWQAGLTNSGTVGQIIGIMANGWLVDIFGYKKMTLICLFLTNFIIFILFFSKSLTQILVGDFLISVPLGALNALAPTYAVEVAPLGLRHYGPIYAHLCVVVGHLYCAGILNVFVDMTTTWAYRIPYALQWVWPLPLFICTLFAPESPWWLLRCGRVDDARKSLKRLVSKQVNSEESLAQIVHTVELEKAMQHGGSIWDCFKGGNLIRTEIACGSFFAQILCGFAIPSGTYFFQVAGMKTEDAFKLNVGQFAMGTISTVITFFWMQKAGRRTVMFVGTTGQMVALGTISILSLLPKQSSGLIWVQGSMVLVRFFFFGLGLGPLAYVTGAEISSAELRRKTMSLGLATFFVITIVSNVVSPYILNPTAANLKGKAAWIATGFCALIMIWSYFRFPETKGRSIEEIDILFARKVPLRKWAYYQITLEQEFGVTSEKAMGSNHVEAL